MGATIAGAQEQPSNFLAWQTFLSFPLQSLSSAQDGSLSGQHWQPLFLPSAVQFNSLPC